MKPRKDLVLVRGLPGRGKSRIAGKIASSFNYAADDYPGLYDDNGVYRVELQSQSHAWCLKQVKQAMMMGFAPIAVHNTFASLQHMQTYIQASSEHGYTVSVVHVEATIYPDGTETKSIHNVPSAVIEDVHKTWQAFNPPYQLLTPKEIADNLNLINIPQVIFADVDGTIKRVSSGDKLPKNSNDFLLNESFIDAWKIATNYYADPLDLFLVSNQRGVGSSPKYKTKDFLIDEMTNLVDKLKDRNIDVTGACFALEKNSPRCLLYFQGQWADIELLTRADKPGIGMVKFFVDHVIEIKNPRDLNAWMVGDGHTIFNASDLAMTRALVNEYPHIRYIPIELFSIAAEFALSC